MDNRRKYFIIAGLMVLVCAIYFAPKKIEPLQADSAGNSPVIEITPKPSGKFIGTRHNPTIKISFVGDILLASSVGGTAAAHGTEYIFEGVRDVLNYDDLTIGNLESAVARCGTPEDKTYTFRANPDVLPGLLESGVDVVSIANNHTHDYGRDAFIETLDHLNELDIPYAGGGMNMDEAASPRIIQVNGQNIAFIASSRVLPSTRWYATDIHPGLAEFYHPERLLEEIRKSRGLNDIVIVYLHWGIEYDLHPQEFQRELARELIDAGADLVIGSHPHILQGFEFYNDKFISYSLGNFVFTNRQSNSAILQITMDGSRIVDIEVIPCQIRNYRPWVVDDNSVRADILRDLENRSYGVSINENGGISMRG